MKELLLLLAGAIGGFIARSAAMKVSFKQRTIDNKIKVYDALIAQWVKMRNFIYAHFSFQPNAGIPRSYINLTKCMENHSSLLERLSSSVRTMLSTETSTR